jgi:protein phosphatase
MGGYGTGRRAADLAASALRTRLLRPPEGQWTEALRGALMAAHDLLRAENGDKRLGAACTLAVVDRGGLWVAYTGDVRAYRVFPSGGAARLTRDMTAQQDQLEDPSRELSAEPGAGRVLRGFLGQRGNLRCVVPRAPITLQEGDRVVLLTDGITSALSDDTIGALAAEPTPARYAQALVRAARAAGSRDDATAAVLMVRTAEAPRRPAQSSKAALDALTRLEAAELQSGKPHAKDSAAAPQRTGPPLRGSALPSRAQAEAAPPWMSPKARWALGGVTVVSLALSGWLAWPNPEPHHSARVATEPRAVPEVTAPRGTSKAVEPTPAPAQVVRRFGGIYASTPEGEQMRAVLHGRLRSQLLSGPRPTSLPAADTLDPPMDSLFGAGSLSATARATLLEELLDAIAMRADVRLLRALEAQLTFRSGDAAVRGALEELASRDHDPLIRDWAKRHMQAPR